MFVVNKMRLLVRHFDEYKKQLLTSQQEREKEKEEEEEKNCFKAWQQQLMMLTLHSL